MSPPVIPWDHPALSIPGALDLSPAADGLAPRRLPAWTRAQMPDPALELMASMPSGVRLRLRLAGRRVELDVVETGLRFPGRDRRASAFDLLIDGDLVARRLADAGPTLAIDASTGSLTVTMDPGEASRVVFDDLPAGDKVVEIWLPHTATVQLRALRADGVGPPPAATSQRSWAHYGSSISHGMEADGPSETWPAIAARAAGVNLTSLGFAGQCHLDGLVARTLRDGDFDLISLKLGINLINADSMRERVFVASVHSFLDTIRDAKPATPILIVSPILCPVAEDAPGPTLSDGAKVYVVERPAALTPGALTLRRVRRLLASIVGRRRTAGDVHLHHLDGLTLFDTADLADLPDGLHPNAAGLRRMGERFAAHAFASGGPFAPPPAAPALES